ncbi:MAG: cytochrome c3 family protein [Coriobacteriia bacterium]|nr:cytochrome c3 family protein [Coriobacteriia bacterium]
MESNSASKVIRIAVWSFAGLVVLLALVLTVTTVTLPGCTFCHSSATFVAQSQSNPHAKLSCTQCHAQPGPVARLPFAYHLIFGMVLHVAPTGGPVSGIPDATCLSCHQNVLKAVVRLNGISIKHEVCAKGRLCVDCHSDAAHGSAVQWQTTATMNTCLDCHDTARVRSDCTMCHAARSMVQRLSTGEWQITHGPNWKQTHGMGDLKTCASCHPDNFCVRCHGIPLPHGQDFLKLHPAYALTNRADCAVCHQQTFCDNCHGLPMPHPDDFTPAHPSIVQKQGQALCLRCHVIDDCTNCHVKHVHPGGATLPPSTGGLK